LKVDYVKDGLINKEEEIEFVQHRIAGMAKEIQFMDTKFKH